MSRKCHVNIKFTYLVTACVLQRNEVFDEFKVDVCMLSVFIFSTRKEGEHGVVVGVGVVVILSAFTVVARLALYQEFYLWLFAELLLAQLDFKIVVKPFRIADRRGAWDEKTFKYIFHIIRK